MNYFCFQRGKIVLMLNVMNNSSATVGNDLSEFELALMVSKIAENYSLLGQDNTQCEFHRLSFTILG